MSLQVQKIKDSDGTGSSLAMAFLTVPPSDGSSWIMESGKSKIP